MWNRGRPGATPRIAPVGECLQSADRVGHQRRRLQPAEAVRDLLLDGRVRRPRRRVAPPESARDAVGIGRARLERLGELTGIDADGGANPGASSGHIERKHAGRIL